MSRGPFRTGDRGAIKLVIEKHNGEKVHQGEFDPREKDILTKKLRQRIQETSYAKELKADMYMGIKNRAEQEGYR